MEDGKLINIDDNFNEIVRIIEERKNNAYRKINEELILMYNDIGKYIYNISLKSNYGDNVVENIAFYMKKNYPALKGVTKRNLFRMLQFYKTYKDNEKVTPLVTQLSWTNNLLILSNCKTEEEREFYLNLSIKENYSKRELDRQLQSSYYQRYMLSEGKQLPSMTKTIDEDDYPNTRILDTYTLEFLDMPNNFSEKELKNGIIKNMKDFILEIGKDFTFISEEYKVQVGNHDFFIDLLFYNRELSCLVAFELKIGEYKAEYLSKMDLYLEALDRNIKKKKENPSVGIILCTSKDESVVEYSMSRNMSQTLVSEYKLKLLDKHLLETKLKETKQILEQLEIKENKLNEGGK